MDISQFIANENEEPLDRLVSDGGFTGIFRKIGAVGDSLASGEFEAVNSEGNKEYHDCFDFSWGQYLARMAGTKVYNFSRGGMTAKEFCQSFADKHNYYSPETACAAYIIALGVNDANSPIEIGGIKDVNFENPTDHPDTFAGWYGELVLRYRAISDDAKFFFVTAPDDTDLTGRHDRLMQIRSFLFDLAESFGNAYVMDLYKYAPKYDDDFRKTFFLYGHMSPTGYMFTAKMFASYIDWIIRQNPDDFREVGFIKAHYERTLL